MTAPVFADVLGPRARRRLTVASFVAAAALAVLVFLIIRRLQDEGQLTAAKWQYFTDRSVIRFLAIGLWNTIQAAMVAMVLALVIGLAAALGRLSGNVLLRTVAAIYIELFRALPVLLMILFAFLVIPRYGPDLPKLWYLVIALTAYNAAVLAEIYRAGVLSLDRGQTEAALSVGLTRQQSMRFVILPQALRRMLPSIVSQLIVLLKDTALGRIISFEDLLQRAQLVGELPGKPILPAFAVAMTTYILINLVLSLLARRLEARQSSRLGGKPRRPGGVEDLAVEGA